MNKLFITALILLTAMYSFAQKGTLKGTINDAKTGESLVGVEVKIEGTDLKPTPISMAILPLTM